MIVLILPENYHTRKYMLYPQAPGSFFVASYDSQGYGGGILTRLRKGRT
jgi:hypothetical protein